MERSSDAKTTLFIGTFFSFLLAFATACFLGRYLGDYTPYLSSYYFSVFWAETVRFFPFIFIIFYLIFLLIFASVTLPFDKKNTQKLLNRILFSVWVFLLFSLAGLFFLVPISYFVKERAAFRSSVAVDSLNKFTESFREGRYREALNFLDIYESVDKKREARFSSVDKTVTFVFDYERGGSFPYREFWLNSQNMRDEILSLLNGENHDQDIVAENSYALKKLGYEKFSFGKENNYYQPIAEAYKIFRYLSTLTPDDREIGFHLQRAEREIRRHVLVKDRIKEESIFPLSHNICFVNADNDKYRQVVYARKLISLTGRNLVESVRVETVYNDGRKSVLHAEYGRIETERILFDSVFLSDPAKITSGYFSEGAADDCVNEHYVPLNVSAQLLPMMDTENRNLAAVPYFDLLRIRNRFPAELDIAGFYEQELIVRSIRLLFLILAPFVMLLWGFRWAPDRKTGYSGFGYLLPPVILAASLFFILMYIVMGVAATACVMFLPFRVLLTVVPILFLVVLTLLIGFFIVSYEKRMS